MKTIKLYGFWVGTTSPDGDPYTVSLDDASILGGPIIAGKETPFQKETRLVAVPDDCELVVRDKVTHLSCPSLPKKTLTAHEVYVHAASRLHGFYFES